MADQARDADSYSAPAAAAMPVFYSVTAEIDEPVVAARYLDWLIGRGEFAESHARHVLAWGGTAADISTIDPPSPPAAAEAPTTIECRYEFPSREALDRYLAEGAPTLRAEGKRLFLDPGGVRMSRRIGTLAARLGRG